MNLPITTPSIIRNHHDYGSVETTKYVDAFKRQNTDPLAAGFKFGYWGQPDYKPENSLKPARSCVGEVKPGSKCSYVVPVPDPPYHAVVDGVGRRSPSPTRSMAAADRGRSPSPQLQRSKSPQRAVSPSRRSAASSRDGRQFEDLVSPVRSARDSTSDRLYVDGLVHQNSNLDRALMLERESRRVLERELREEARARKLLEGSLEEASVSFHRAKDRLRGLATENEELRRVNEEMRQRFAALEQQVRMGANACRFDRQCLQGGVDRCLDW